MHTLFLSWRTRNSSRRWFPVGRLDIEAEPTPSYRFRYIRGAKQAQDQAKFPLLVEFPKLERSYEFGELFPVFQNRVTRPTRPDFSDYVHSLGLTEDASAFDILSVSGGRRVTDPYEVFPKLAKNGDGSFVCRFFLHGEERAAPAVRDRIQRLQPEETLLAAASPGGIASGPAVQLQTEDGHVIGWTPDYLVPELTPVLANPAQCSAQVAQINQRPYKNRHVLIEMRGNWGDHEPMSGAELQPLVD